VLNRCRLFCRIVMNCAPGAIIPFNPEQRCFGFCVFRRLTFLDLLNSLTLLEASFPPQSPLLILMSSPLGRFDFFLLAFASAFVRHPLIRISLLNYSPFATLPPPLRSPIPPALPLATVYLWVLKSETFFCLPLVVLHHLFPVFEGFLK